MSKPSDPQRIEADAALIRHFFQCQASRDWTGLTAVFDEDAVFELPYLAEVIQGRDAILTRMRPALERMDGLRFFDLDIKPMAERGAYVAEYKGSAVMATTALTYDQTYIALFQIDHGRICRFREYMDPLVLALSLKRVVRIA